MKNLFIKTIPFFSILFVACSSDDAIIENNNNPSSSVNTKQMTFSASMDADDDITRTYIETTDKKTYWSKSDKILVYNTTKNSQGEFSIPDDKYEEKSKNAIFTGEALSINEGEGAENNFIALYPADANALFTSDNTITATLPSRQDLSKANSINTDYFFMTGRTTASNFAFKNAVSFVKVEIKSSANFPISRLKIVSNADTYIAGNFTATIASDGTPNISITDNKSTFVELYKDDFSTLDDGVYYLAVLPSKSNGAGMTLLLEDVNGNKAYQRIKTNFTFVQSQMYNLGSYTATDSEVNGKMTTTVTASLGTDGTRSVIENVVDLGLPSGTLWAMNDVTNVSGDNSETSGYYAWGEVNSKDAANYTWQWEGRTNITFRNATYKYGAGNPNDKDNYIMIEKPQSLTNWVSLNGQAGLLNRYNTADDYGQNKSDFFGFNATQDNKSILGTNDDAANKMNSQLCMPTEQQAKELINNAYTTVSGFTVTSKVSGYEGRSIKFNDGGFKRQGTSHFLTSGTLYNKKTYVYSNNSENGYYWLRTLAKGTVIVGNANNSAEKNADFMAMSFFITSSGITINKADRCEGRKIRPVVANHNAAVSKAYEEIPTNTRY